MAKVKSYGLDLSKFPVPPNQLEIELLYIASNDPLKYGGLDKGEHIKNVIKMLYPWVWDNWHEWNDLCLWAWLNYDEIGMTGCASAHKTFTFSLLSFIEWLAKPSATTVTLTSTTVPSLRARIWNEIKKFYTRAVIPFDSFNLKDSHTILQSQKGDDKFAIRAVAVDSGKVEDAVGKIQGVHPERMIIIVDEAAQTPPAIFAARANLQSGTKLYKFVAIANAVDQFDSHGRFCEPKGGWSTITPDHEWWETRTGVCLHFDGLKSPNVKRQKERFPHLFSQKEIDNIRKNFGENSLEWWSYVRGFWAPRGVRNTVLDASMIFDKKADAKVIWEGSAKEPIAALDPAFTTNGDRCILRFGLIGNFADGKLGLSLEEIVNIQLIESTEVPLNYQIADRVIQECNARGVKPENFIMDSTSASGLADIIAQRWGSNAFTRINFGGKPMEGPVSFEDKREAKDVYENKVTQLWFTFQRMVNLGRIRGLDQDTAQEFCTRQYTLRREKTVIESKSEMKERTGGKSPDLADAAVLLNWKFFMKNNGVSSPLQAKGLEDWEKIVNKMSLEVSYAS